MRDYEGHDCPKCDCEECECDCHKTTTPPVDLRERVKQIEADLAAAREELLTANRLVHKWQARAEAEIRRWSIFEQQFPTLAATVSRQASEQATPRAEAEQPKVGGVR